MRRRGFFKVLLGTAAATLLKENKAKTPKLRRVQEMRVMRDNRLKFSCHEEIGVTICNPAALVKCTFV